MAVQICRSKTMPGFQAGKATDAHVSSTQHNFPPSSPRTGDRAVARHEASQFSGESI